MQRGLLAPPGTVRVLWFTAVWGIAFLHHKKQLCSKFGFCSDARHREATGCGKQAKKEKIFSGEIRFLSSCICASPMTEVTPERCLPHRLGILRGGLLHACVQGEVPVRCCPCGVSLKLWNWSTYYLSPWSRLIQAGVMLKQGSSELQICCFLRWGAGGTITPLSSLGEKLQASA